MKYDNAKKLHPGQRVLVEATVKSVMYGGSEIALELYDEGLDFRSEYVASPKQIHLPWTDVKETS